MASAHLREELTCSVCLNIYTDPVTLPCGYSYCRLCIVNVLDTQDGSETYKCPECRAEFQERPTLEKNRKLRNIAETFRSTHPEQEEVEIPCTYCDFPVPAAKTCLHCEASLCENHLQKHSKSPEHILTEPTTSLENRKCFVHKKILEYYCWEDAVCICVSCNLAGEHRGHQVETLNEASEKKKKKLRNILQKLTSQREEAENRVQSLQELKSQVQGNKARITEQVTALIKDIREQLEVLEKQVLSEISWQEEQVSLRVSDLIRQLEIKKEDLSRKMGHIEELRNMMDPLTVLQGQESDRAEDTERHYIKVHDVGDLDVGLISETLNSGLAEIVTRIKRRSRVLEASGMLLGVNTASGMLLGVNTASDMLLGVNTTSHMLLDVNTAGNDVFVSEDLKTVSWSEIYLRRPETPEIFEYPQVLSSRSFSSGRHYWEVEGSESGEWEVGMSYPSIDRRGDESGIGNNNKSWVLGMNNNKSWGLGRSLFNKEYSLKHGSESIPLPHSPSSCRFRIFLDYEDGRLSFYELCDPIRHLHTFTATFTEPLHAVFRVYWGNSWVRI